MKDLFSLDSQVVVITGGAGFLGVQHGLAVAENGGLPVLLDVSGDSLKRASQVFDDMGLQAVLMRLDVTNSVEVSQVARELISTGNMPTALINNVASNPPMLGSGNLSKFEDFALAQWERDLNLGLTSAFVCSQTFGEIFKKNRKGSIVNVASDLALIAPDQRVYQDPKFDATSWPEKPISYSVAKSGLLGLTRHLAALWGSDQIRVNAVALGSVKGTQGEFLERSLIERIPLGRLANSNEYKGLIVFLLSEASSYITGATIVADGGRTIW